MSANWPFVSFLLQQVYSIWYKIPGRLHSSARDFVLNFAFFSEYIPERFIG
jgi:hypothetical protein